jgi:hypothetical protein
MKRIFYKITAAVICLMNWGCLTALDGGFTESESDDSMTLKVANKSQDSICVYLAIDAGKAMQVKELLANMIPPHAFGYSVPLLSIGNGSVAEMPPNGIMECYIIHKDTLRKYGLEEVCASNRTEVRYDLTENDIIRLPYLVFPPDRSMRGVRMEPAYESIHQKQ